MKKMADHINKMKAKGHFIQSAIKRPGALTRKAAKAGESLSGFAKSMQDNPGLTGQEARFYENVLKKVKH